MLLGLLLTFAIQVAGGLGIDAGMTLHRLKTADPVESATIGHGVQWATLAKLDGDRGSHAVRPTGAVLGQALEEGRRRSSTVKGLSDQLEHSDLIVYLQIGSCPDAQSIACLSSANTERHPR